MAQAYNRAFGGKIGRFRIADNEVGDNLVATADPLDRIGRGQIVGVQLIRDKVVSDSNAIRPR